ncbi:hypothetical protein ACFJIV_11055 [Mucilaginibacter sp. UC70_90]
MRLTTGRLDSTLLSARNTLTQRTIGPQCSGTTLIDVANMKDGDFAGLVLLQQKYGFVGVKSDHGSKQVVMINAQSGSAIEAASIPLKQTTIYLKASCDFTNRADKAYFFYSLDGRKMGTYWHTAANGLYAPPFYGISLWPV